MMGTLLLLQVHDHHRIRTAGLRLSGRIPVNAAADCQTSNNAHHQHIVLLEKEGVRTNVQLQSVKWLPPLPRGVKPWKEWSRDYLTKVRKAKAGFELVG
jgi:hypothetical protein